MKKSITVFFALCLIVNLSSCLKADNNLELKLCGSYGVHGMYYGDLKGMESGISVLETDTYNRTLFAYSAPNVFINNELTAYVICQKVNDDYVFFYEDICYYIGDPTTSALDQLKLQNDWNAPINEDKLSKRKNNITLDLFICLDRVLTHSEVCEAVAKRLGISLDQIQGVGFLDISPTKQELHWIQVNDEGALRQYLSVITPDGRVALLEISSGIPEPIQISQFKAASNWSYD